MDGLPFSQACENNKGFILEVLREVFADRHTVLEVGSGSGQHATYFAQNLSHLKWQPTEIPAHAAHLRPRCQSYAGNNLLPPTALDVWDEPWQVVIPDAVFSANTLHIMSLSSVRRFFEVLAGGRPADLVLAIYGPFNYDGRYTSDSNARFDQWLAAQHPDSAIRDFEVVDALAQGAGLTLYRDHEMPANNRLLVWRAAVTPDP